VNVSNFIDNSAGNERGAGASKNFTGDRMAKKSMRAEAGVIESQLGIIETTNIDSLNQNSNKDDSCSGYKNTKKPEKAEAGVIEAHPGTIETTNIDPLNKKSNKDDSWASSNGTGNLMTSTSEMAGSAYKATSTIASGAAKTAYGTATGHREIAEEGKREMFGSD